jgi:uncharacterized lipoprotein YddW (UPF0748 family)
MNRTRLVSASLWRRTGALCAGICGLLAPLNSASAQDNLVQLPPIAEIRGTWVTTTGNDAIASPENTARTMKRLREIGLNTVYVETWKNGYTQFPSKTLMKTIGVDRRPALMPQDPSDKPDAIKAPGRDLLQETLIEAHRNGLNYIAWFEYGFMAAHKSTDNHLRRMKKEWLSLDKDGNEVAPNGFVWMNPLHPEARRFLLDIVLEAVDNYDLDGVQLDDRIVWPYYTMGYDAYTKAAYAKDHNGKEPPLDAKDPEWTRWRVEKVNEFSKMFVQEIRAARPDLVISLSPAVYPWCYENYLLEWPKWAAWTKADALAQPEGWKGNGITPLWDEFIPQCYRMNYKAFETTWIDQVKWMKEMGAGRVEDLIAGIRVVGDGPDSTWDDLKSAMALVRSTGGGGHVHWFSRGVLDLFPTQLTSYYRTSGPAFNPQVTCAPRDPSIALRLDPGFSKMTGIQDRSRWFTQEPVVGGTYTVIGVRNGQWDRIGSFAVETLPPAAGGSIRAKSTGNSTEVVLTKGGVSLQVPADVTQVEILLVPSKGC